MMKTIQALLAALCLFCTYTSVAQQQFDLRFALDEVDCEARQICYFTQIRSGNGEAWNLADQNYRIFYDASMAAYIEGSAERVVDPDRYSSVFLAANVQDVDASTFPADLDFRATLSFLNYAIVLESQTNGGVNLPTDGSYLNTSRLCFDVTQELIENGSECLSLVWAEMGRTDAIATAFNEISEWVGDTNIAAEERILDNLDAEDGDDSCISTFCGGTASENTDSACSDGIDNDEDGLVDCADPNCATTVPCAPPANEYEVALEVNSVDCSTGMVCYDVQIETANDSSFILANQRYQLFYSSAVGSFVSGESVLGDEYGDLTLQNSTPIENVNATGVGSLPYEGDLGFITFTIGLTDVDAGSSVLVEPGFPVRTAELCFVMSDEAITTVDACFEATWAREGATDDYNNTMVEVDAWIGPGNVLQATSVGFGDLSAASGDAACFDDTCPPLSSESGDDDCSDGMDNDDDGLVDCFDADCAEFSDCSTTCFALAPVLTISGDAATGIECDFVTGQIDISATGENTTPDYSTTYILTTADGVINAISNSPSFDLFTEGFYGVYAINFRSATTMISGLSVGGSIADVTGDDCFDIGDPIFFNVCIDATRCNFCLGEPVEITPTNAPDPARTTQFVLTDRDGVILDISDNNVFTDLDEGIHIVFVIDFASGASVTGLEVGQNITDIAPGDIRITESFIAGVCDQLMPTIFFDLKGCDILETAILQVGEDFTTYMWSTGSTESFIEVSATDPATYTVTVTLDDNCVGVVSQEITGDEPTRVGDFVWEDTNGNGRQDANESGVNGVTVNLFTDFNNDGVPDFADFPSCVTMTIDDPTTGNPGYYEFFVYQSSYIVGFESPTGFVPTTQSQGDANGDSDIDAQGLTSTVAVVEGEERLDIDAGFRTSTTLCGAVWSDEDGDGRRDETEGGVDNITVNLFSADGERVATTVSFTDPETDEVGRFCFENVPVQDYYVEIILPDGIVLTDPNVATDESRDSDADGTFGPGTTSLITTLPGEITEDVGFGIYVGGVTCGVLWLESEQGNEGIFDEGVDSLITNSQVELLEANTGEISQIVTTDDEGRYCVNSIRAGSYQVRFRANSTGESFVSPNQGDDPLIDSDVDITTGATGVFFVGPMDSLLGVNGGLRLESLPVELVAFSGYWDPEQSAIELSWVTASEINNDFFELERVVDQDGDFVAIEEIEGNGTTTALQLYGHTDQDVAASGTYYYRLKQVDFDGGYEYSDIIEIDVLLNKDVGLKAYPNPVENQTILDIIVSRSDIAEISVTDFIGRAVMRSTLHDVQTGHNPIEMDLSTLPPGPYLIKVQMGSSIQHELIQKAR